MRNRSLMAVLAGFLLLLSTASQASIFGGLVGKSNGPLPVEEAYQFEAVELAPGEYELRWLIEDGYYLYKDKIKLSYPAEVRIIGTEYAETELKDDPLFGEVQVYYQQAMVIVKLGSSSPEQIANIEVEYQGCWEGGICYPPVTKLFSASFNPSEPSGAIGSTAAPKAPALSTGSTRNLPDALASRDTGLSLTDQNQVTRFLGEASFPLIIALFFVAGLALSLTPCVFPMVPILAGVIAGQNNQSTGKGFLMSLTYVLAMAFTYTLAGVAAGLFGGNIQAAFQAPWIIVLFSLLFVVFAGAMFGFYHLEMPHRLQNRLNLMCRSQQGGQFAGVAVMGFLSALIVGPCVAAPLAGALIFIGQTGDPWLGGSALFSLSLGMGAPLILVGTSAAKMLPTAGKWMNTVKHSFGVIMLLMAVWMLDRIVPTAVTMVLAGSVLVITAVFLSATDRLLRTASVAQRLSKGAGILLLVYGLSLLVGAVSGSKSLIYPLQGLVSGGVAGSADNRFMAGFTTVESLEELTPILQSAKTAGRPVMLDLYADWCVSCKELEVVTFADSKVQQQLSQYALVKVDLTDNGEEAKAIYKKYQVVGPPALIFYDREGQEKSEKMVVGVPSAADFLAHISDI